MTPAPRSVALGTEYAISGAALFGINGSVSKVVVGAGVTPEQVTLGRSATTALIAGVWLAFAAPRQLRLSRGEAVRLAALGIGGLAMIQWLYTLAISLLPVGIALLFQYTAIMMVALWAWLVFKERVHPRLWLAIAAVLAGLAVVAQVWNSGLNPLGIAAAMGAAVAYAFYFLAGARGVARRPPIAVVFWASVFAAGFWAIFSRWWQLDPATLAASTSLGGNLAHLSAPVWALLLWVVTLGGFAPFLLSFQALKHLSATTLGILASSEVLFAFVVAWVWLGETLSPLQLGGAAVVLAGIVVAQTARADSAPRNSPPLAAGGDIPLTPDDATRD
jgi:drug/metabolite transporter (DMT)-like permease